MPETKEHRMIAIAVTSSFVLMCGISIFAYTYRMTDPYILPKWCYTLAAGLVWLSLWAVGWMWKGKSGLSVRVAGCGIALLCTVEALWGLAQAVGWLPASSGFRVTGSFDNPAGYAACLCAGLPFAGYCGPVLGKQWGREVGIAAVMLMAVGIISSGSRSGMVALAVMAAVWGWHRVNLPAWQKGGLLTVATILLLWGVYLLKKDSADGRLLVWRCAWEMVKDAPVLGHGPGGFRAHYMDYQAAYLDTHPDSPYARLADNVISPFNEYLHLWLDFGLVGLLAVTGLVGRVLYKHRRDSGTESRVAVCVLWSMAAFSFFSYPFTYPFTWIGMLFALYSLTGRKAVSSCPLWCRRMVAVAVWVVCVAVAVPLGRRIVAERQWYRIAYVGGREHMDTYARLMPVLGEEPYFLYNYAAALLEAHEPEQSLAVARKCRTYWADYDLELLLGLASQDKGLYRQAEDNYRLAYRMCPSHFTPLYRLYELYKEEGDKERMRQTAREIVEKPMKIETREIRMMKRKVKREALSDGEQ